MSTTLLGTGQTWTNKPKAVIILEQVFWNPRPKTDNFVMHYEKIGVHSPYKNFQLKIQLSTLVKFELPQFRAGPTW
jgi:hypothetical protein